MENAVIVQTFGIKEDDEAVKQFETIFAGQTITTIDSNGSEWPVYVTQATQQLNDKNIYTLFVPYKNTPGHPKKNEQKALADSLINFIDKNIVW